MRIVLRGDIIVRRVTFHVAIKFGDPGVTPFLPLNCGEGDRGVLRFSKRKSSAYERKRAKSRKHKTYAHGGEDVNEGRQQRPRKTSQVPCSEQHYNNKRKTQKKINKEILELTKLPSSKHWKWRGKYTRDKRLNWNNQPY